MTGDAESPREKAAAKTLKGFIKDETGLNNEVIRRDNWQEVADELARGRLHLALFQGYEFAWAQERHPGIRALALGVNVYTYPTACVVARRNNPAEDFAGLRRQTLALPITSHGYLGLFVERQSEAAGKTAQTFFSKITFPDNVEDALDDVVDGKVQFAVIDRAALEAYRRRKPGRFNRLREVVRSQPFPPAVVAYYQTGLDEANRRRFKEGLLGAVSKERGEMLLTLCRLTGFETPRADFGRVVADTRKAYPPNGKPK
jgi:ABC-type phosphate/phosphonate transport system substrate-binding protein